MPQLFDDDINLITLVTINGVVHSGGKDPWGQLLLSYYDALPSPPPAPIDTTLISDPPIPPVWPVLGAGKWASDVIYGSERMNTNLRFVRGNTYAVDCIAVLDGLVVDLTNKTLSLTVKKNLNDAANFIQLTSPSGGISITNASGGAFTCTFAANLTSGLPAYIQRFPYDIEMTEGATVNTLARGYLIIVPSVG